MLIETSARGLVIHAPAKVNLFLEVLGKREDGYHQIDTVMCPVTLFDTLEFEPRSDDRLELLIDPASSGGQGTATTDPAWQIPADGTNLVVRALDAVRRELGVQHGCRVRLTKCIPAAAGLGGGSSDAAAAIVAGLTMWAGWDRSAAQRLGAALGSDIPLFFGDAQRGCGLAHATGRGEHVEILASQPELNFVITHPPAGASTAAVYQRWQSSGSTQSSHSMLRACHQLADQPNSNAVERALFNALQQPTSGLTPWIDQQLAAFARLGKLSALMSGSGTACYALTEGPEEARYLTEKLIALGLPRVYAAQAWYAAPIETQLDRIAEDLD